MLLNQRIRFTASLDLITASGQSLSRFICIPLESGSINEDTQWGATPNVKASDFPTLSIGNNGTGGAQADSDYEYLRIYNDLLVGTVTSSDDADTLLASMTKTLNLDYKHTTYMKYLGTSTTMGQFEQEITVNADPDVTILDETIQGNVFQLSWADNDNEYSEIGRAFLSPVFYPANQIDDAITWSKQKFNRRSKKMLAESGATYFDKHDSISMYTIVPEVLNQYYNSLAKTGYEDFLDAVQDYQCFYVILESDSNNAIYVFIPGDVSFERIKNTPMIKIPNLILQEQK